jgi:hypothetical protein
MVEDPFVVLGVPRGATEDEMRRAFRRQARRHHPDAGGDAEAFVAVERAYRSARRLAARRRRPERRPVGTRAPRAATDPTARHVPPTEDRCVPTPTAPDHRTGGLAAARLGFLTPTPTSTRTIVERPAAAPTPLRSFAEELERALSTVPDRSMRRR